MAKVSKSLRVDAALDNLISAAAERAGRSWSDEVLTTLAAQYIGEDSAPAPRGPKAAKPPSKPATVTTGAALRERDLSPKLGDAQTSGDGRGAGIVSGLSLPLGNERRPYQKGQGAAAKAKR